MPSIFTRIKRKCVISIAYVVRKIPFLHRVVDFIFHTIFLLKKYIREKNLKKTLDSYDLSFSHTKIILRKLEHLISENSDQKKLNIFLIDDNDVEEDRSILLRLHSSIIEKGEDCYIVTLSQGPSSNSIRDDKFFRVGYTVFRSIYGLSQSMRLCFLRGGVFRVLKNKDPDFDSFKYIYQDEISYIVRQGGQEDVAYLIDDVEIRDYGMHVIFSIKE